MYIMFYIIRHVNIMTDWKTALKRKKRDLKLFCVVFF